MQKSLHVVIMIAALILHGCIGVGAWTLGDRMESSERPHIDQTRGSIDLRKADDSSRPGSAMALRAQWGEPDRVVAGETGKTEWIYKTDGLRWAGLVLYVVVIPLPLMVPIGSQYVSFVIEHEQIESATRADWAFKAGV